MALARRILLGGCIALLLGWLGSVFAEEVDQDPVVITIIIDDMGNRADWDEASLGLPGPVTYAFLPHTPHAERLARAAHARGKEVMLHLPMQSHEGNRLGPGALTLHMTELAFKKTLAESLAAVPNVRGINNHMGSLLTRHPGAMEWLMQGIREQGHYFFIDSRTSRETVGQQLAREYGVDNASRDVFLDNERDPVYIRGQFKQLLRRARQQGYAIGIGHTYPETTQVLRQELAELEGQNILLVPASVMIDFQQRSGAPWQEPSSPSPKVARNLKPSPSSTCCDAPVSKSSPPDSMAGRSKPVAGYD